MTSLILLSDWYKSQIEFWLPLPNWYGYDVSSWGRVRTRWIGYGKRRRVGGSYRLLKPTLTRKGYLVVTRHETRKGKRKSVQVRVNRAVASAFLQNPNEWSNTNHMTGVKTDNRLGNIEWISDEDNQRHARVSGLREGVSYKLRSLSWETVTALKMRVLAGVPVAVAAREIGVSKYVAYNIVKGKSYRRPVDQSVSLERLRFVSPR